MRLSGRNAGSAIARPEAVAVVSFATTTRGTFVDTIVLHGIGHNASGFSGSVGDITLRIQGTVAPVPAPSTYMLMLGGLGW